MPIHTAFSFVNGLRQKPKDFDFSITPTLIFSRPPEDVKIINRGMSFALALEWGYWAIAVWFVYTHEDVCWEKCESCEKKFDYETMTVDSGGYSLCPKCWEELAPVMKQEYEEMVAKGEIDPDYY